MARFGFAPLPGWQPEGASDTLYYGSYGLWDAEYAAEHGYEPQPLPNPNQSLGPTRYTGDAVSVYIGQVESYQGEPVPPGGCQGGEARQPTAWGGHMRRSVARLKRRFVRAMAVTLASIVGAGLGAIAISSPAVAGSGYDCPSGNFCWYDYTSLDGPHGQQYYYTSGYVWMSVLQRNNMSSIEKQWADGCLPATFSAINGHPAVWLKASSGTYLQGAYMVGSYTGERYNTFYYMQPARGGPTENMNNKFDLIWNYCQR